MMVGLVKSTFINIRITIPFFYRLSVHSSSIGKLSIFSEVEFDRKRERYNILFHLKRN